MSSNTLKTLPENPKAFCSVVQKDPKVLISLLKNRDPRLKYLFKRRKKRAITSCSIKEIELLLTDVDYTFNKQVWMSLKSALKDSPEALQQKTGCFFQQNEKIGSHSLLIDGNFIMWLLSQGSISPHHCRRFLQLEERVLKKFGIPLSVRTPCDVLFHMHYLLIHNLGGAKDLFHLSRYWWIYNQDFTSIHIMVFLLKALILP
ncbi:MAG: hypothetical protein PHE86_00195 [Candidatus Marinimicrobia bacterium]|nr:hypothetical protein [Candidatus Neomarinimicrobiota bacterium]MDD5583141.1 hypothetical protein [Candidatus Neomarinimicrobiota bacterium]